ncbi:hypothetical protein SASPL_107217 [Salvia splendens]|uniref:Uncharacterized protein n=1 Tax=Salvia splendens TaxID=180675 RepID=A0A8X8YAZ0_SALSN|nr:hypothetical protein SASPL_107217 [Salvia splendens]
MCYLEFAVRSSFVVLKLQGLVFYAREEAFVLRHPLVASAVFGATKLWQLQEVLDGCRVELTPEIIAEINEVHSAFPNPCP